MKVKRFFEMNEASVFNDVQINKGHTDKDVEKLLKGLTITTYKRKVHDIKPVHVTGIIGVGDSPVTNRLEVTLSNRDRLEVTYTKYAKLVHVHFCINDDDIIYRKQDAEYSFESFIEAVVAAYRAHLTHNTHRVIEANTEPTIEDLEAYGEDDEKIDMKDWGIETILSIDTAPTEVNEAAVQPLQTDMQVKDVKRGDILWITAMLKPKSDSTMYNAGKIGVLKVRVVDLYYNLNILKTVK